VEIAGHACRTDFDLAAHVKGSGVDLSIFKPYPTPVEKTVSVVVPLQSVLGPLLRERAGAIVQALSSSNPEELKTAFRDHGHFEIDGFEVLPSHVRLEDRKIRETGRRFMPYVVEPSFGAERVVYSTMEYAYSRLEDRVVLRIPVNLAPIQLTVFPLMAKDGLAEIGREIADFVAAKGFDVEYDEAGTIGKRYARADEIGVPISVTVDYQTKKDQTVTLRDRDSWQQIRAPWGQIPELARGFLKGEKAFSTLGAPVKVAYE